MCKYAEAVRAHIRYMQFMCISILVMGGSMNVRTMVHHHDAVQSFGYTRMRHSQPRVLLLALSILQ
jgi:hypothetical protein